MNFKLPTLAILLALAVCACKKKTDDVDTQQDLIYTWAKELNAGALTSSQMVRTDVEGNIYIAGRFEGTADFQPGAYIHTITCNGYVDGFLAKYDPTGKLIFVKKIGGTGYDYVTDMVINEKGNIYITGVFNGKEADMDDGSGTHILNGHGYEDIFVAAYTSAGDYIFSTDIGNTTTDLPYSIDADAEGNTVITARRTSNLYIDQTTPGVMLKGMGGYIFKLNASGNFVFVNELACASPFYLSSKIDASGNIYATGLFYDETLPTNGQSDNDFYTLIKFNPEGKQVSGLKNDFGSFRYDMMDMQANGDALIYVVGEDRQNIFLTKYNANGNKSVSKKITAMATPDTGGVELNYVTTDIAGNLYLTGYFKGGANFGNNKILTSKSPEANEYYIAKYNTDGQCVYAKKIDVHGDIAIDKNFNVLMSGNIKGTQDADPGEEVHNLVTCCNINTDPFIAKYAQK
ncbi:SBBP repeat-containing protein [Mucilaginibacter gynuensis]|uniref:SBBP repeat-containing protein n=1 Tax=Mucilaginibacter gynuensis TaxID=1302236 RepID=A0ABP8GQ54_9SPHI